MKSDFFALLARMKYIERWSLMRNITRENIAEHSFFVALLSHALACIRRDVLGLPCDPERAAALALFTGLSNLFIVGLGAAAGLIAMEVKTRRDLS